MFIKRKPWPFINDYHSVCCEETGVIWSIELVEGKDRPHQRGPKKFDNIGATVGLLVKMSRPIWNTGNMLVLDSGFFVLKVIEELKIRGVYTATLIKKRR